MTAKELVLQKHPNGSCESGIRGNSKTFRNVFFVSYRKDNYTQSIERLSWATAEDRAWYKAAKKLKLI